MADADVDGGPEGGNGNLFRHAVLAPFSYGYCSETGPVREGNDDYAGVFAPTIPADAWDRSALFVVADGMGGHSSGDVAARIAVESMLSTWADQAADRPSSALKQAVRAANLAVYDAAESPQHRGMGTTLTACTLQGNELTVAHVGDSRAYLVRGTSCTQLTEDHTRVAEMVRARLLTADRVRHHPSRSQLTRSLGSDPLLAARPTSTAIERGDVIVLCTDGLWDEVDEDELTALVAKGADGTAGALARTLVDRAIVVGATDNVTAMVVIVQTAGPIPPAKARRSVLRRGRWT
jgi:serine/threonine protein phosphatase PrpC